MKKTRYKDNVFLTSYIVRMYQFIINNQGVNLYIPLKKAKTISNFEFFGN